MRWPVLFMASLTLSIAAQNAADVKPSPQQSAWQDLEFGVIVHFSTNTFLNQEWGDGTADPKAFNPTQFDPNQWMDAIKASGAKYLVLVAKHHDGFCLWPTKQTDYSVQRSPWQQGKGDLVREVARAAHAHGLKFGVYLSPWDRHEPKYKDPVAYDAFYNAQLTELASNYGELVEFWLDGAGSTGRKYNFKSILETLRTYQPNTIVFADAGLIEYGDARWGGDESGRIDYQNWNVLDRHGYLRWRPVEVDTPLRKLHWFWHPNDEASLKSVPDLLESYEHAVGHGGQWMIGLAPDSRGLLPDSDVVRLKELGNAITSRYGVTAEAVPIRSADPNSSRAFDGDPDTFWTAPADSHSAVLEAAFAKPVTIDRALTMEWLVEGQNVQRYRIEAYQAGKWVSIVTSEAIGHKKIDRFPPVTTDRIRLNLLSSSGIARIREFHVFVAGKGE